MGVGDVFRRLPPGAERLPLNLPVNYLNVYVSPVVNWNEFFLKLGGGLLR